MNMLNKKARQIKYNITTVSRQKSGALVVGIPIMQHVKQLVPKFAFSRHFSFIVQDGG